MSRMSTLHGLTRHHPVKHGRWTELTNGHQMACPQWEYDARIRTRRLCPSPNQALYASSNHQYSTAQHTMQCRGSEH
jgi:hypothetical protein